MPFLKIFIISLFASIALFIDDLGHIHSNVAIYPGDQGTRLFQIPLWVILEFFLAAFILIIFYPLKEKIFKFNDSPVKLKDVIISFSITISIYLMTSIPENFITVKLIILISILLIQIFLYRMNNLKSLFDIFIFALGGCAFEFFLGTKNIFVYLPNPSVFFSIPVWLPLIYLSAGISARLGGRYLF